MLNQELLKRNIPPLKSTEEMLEILQNEIYGRAIPVPESLSFSEPEEILPRFLANKSTFNKIIATLSMLELNGYIKEIPGKQYVINIK